MPEVSTYPRNSVASIPTPAANGYVQFERLTKIRQSLTEAIERLELKLGPVTANRPCADGVEASALSTFEAELNFLSALDAKIYRLADSIVL